MSAPLQMRFLTSAATVTDLPPTTAEVAVAGRSNVGKSSLLNAVAGRRELARTSKTPGRTQLLNCFAVDALGTMVDLPGYGYAKASATDRAAWQRRTERYLRDRENLALVLLLVDGEVGPTRLDEQMLDWLRRNAGPFRVVATKHDKVRSSQRVRRRRELAAGCAVAEQDVLWVSAQRNVNIDRLRQLVRDTLRSGRAPQR